MQTITDEQRRVRLGTRHLLALPARTVEETAAAMVGLHSSDPVTVYLSARARVNGFAVEDLEAALYERRTLVRMLGMRRTLFVVPLDLAAVMDEACTKVLAPAEHRRLVTMLEAQGIADDGIAWIDRVSERTLAVLAEHGEMAAAQITKLVPELTAKLTFGEGTTWGGQVGVSTRVLFLLAAQGRVVRARPRGSWISGQYRWARTEAWLGGSLPTIERGEASADLLRRWLTSFGPGTLTDIRWWTGWTLRQTKAALEAIDAIEVGLQTGEIGYLLADDIGPADDVSPWVRLLPSLDPTTMGWKQRDWYLGEHAKALFDRNGNAGPTIWANGRVIGGWTQHADGRIATRLLERVDRATERRVTAEADYVETWLGETRVTPRFRTPLDRELSV